MQTPLRFVVPFVALVLMVTIGVPAHADFSTWEISEVYSNADGTIQYIEFYEWNGQNAQGSFTSKSVETFISGACPNCFSARYLFPNDPGGSITANKHALMATAGFQNLLGSVTPDFIMPDNFIDLSVVVSIKLSTFTPIIFAVGDIPSVGNLAYYPAGPSTGATSPTNFAGDVGNIDLPEPDAAILCITALATLAVLRRSPRYGRG